MWDPKSGPDRLGGYVAQGTGIPIMSKLERNAIKLDKSMSSGSARLSAGVVVYKINTMRCSFT
jgi:hypothetical protein